MQPSIDRIKVSFFSLKRSHTLKRPMSDAQTRAVRDDATQYAARLLDHYKQQLSGRQSNAD